MTTTKGSLTIIDLGTPNVKYFWKGKTLDCITKVFVYRGISLTVHHNGLSEDIVKEMKEYGLKVKK